MAADFFWKKPPVVVDIVKYISWILAIFDSNLGQTPKKL